MREQLDNSASVHVYCVSKALPKEDAALWGEDFIQAELLYNQPQEVDNCQRDNRWPTHITHSYASRFDFFLFDVSDPSSAACISNGQTSNIVRQVTL